MGRGENLSVVEWRPRAGFSTCTRWVWYSKMPLGWFYQLHAVYEANLPICWVSLGRGEDWIGGECCLRLLCVSTRCSVGMRLFAWCLAGLLLCLCCDAGHVGDSRRSREGRSAARAGRARPVHTRPGVLTARSWAMWMAAALRLAWLAVHCSTGVSRWLRSGACIMASDLADLKA